MGCRPLRRSKVSPLMDDPPQPPDDGTRYLGSELTRSGDQGMFIHTLGRGLIWFAVALVRALRYLYDGVRSIGHSS